ncbi:MAG: GntR family transcriptional regulator [Bryobacteraceae bacterium]
MKPIVSVPKAERVRQAILEMIFNGTLTAGQRVIEAKLGEQLGVAQATVNAALQDLHNQGIVTKLLNRSTTVNCFTHREIDELFRVRTVLEPAAAAAASSQLTPEGLAALWGHVERMRSAARSRDLPLFCLTDYSFHQELYQLSNNRFLIQACQAISAAPFAYILCGSAPALPTDYEALAEDHAEVVSAIERGPAAARRFTLEKIANWKAHSAHALEGIAQGEAAHAVR